MKKLTQILGIISLIIMMAACSNDNGTGMNKTRVFAKGTYTNAPSKTSSDIVLTSFKINITDIAFKYADTLEGNHHEGDLNHDGCYSGEDTVALSGPWELDLLNQTTEITSVTIPNGTYERVELKLGKSLLEVSPLFNKTVEITGTINGTPFVYWNDFNQKLKIDYDDEGEDLVIDDTSFDLVFNFDLNQLINSVNLNAAVDGDGDGTIEIGPDDTDGNNALAHALSQHMGHCGHMEGGHHHHND